MLPTLRELGIGFVPYSPLGRGFLTGQIALLRPAVEIPISAPANPRFAGDNLAENLRIVDEVEAVAAEVGCDAGPGGAGLAAGPGR